jgi:hypothetical protein
VRNNSGAGHGLAPLFIALEVKVHTMFEKNHLEALFDELERQWRSSPEFDRLSRDAHLGIALWDAGRPLDRIDPRVVTLIEKHKPKE